MLKAMKILTLYDPINTMPKLDIKQIDTANICRILLVEDDEDDFYFFNMALTSVMPNVTLLRTANGIMFSSLIQTSIKPDVIFMDIRMPFKGGLACLKEIRSNERFNDIKVVMYSSSITIENIEDCYNSGADFLIAKANSHPVAAAQLKALFDNPFFKQSIRPPKDKFVISGNAIFNPLEEKLGFEEMAA